jgi:hypothetical protein
MTILPRGIGCVLLAGILMFAVAGAVNAARNAKAKHLDRKVPCAVRGTPERLRVDCRSTSVAALLNALHKGVGLRSEYPQELAAAPVSLSLRRGTLHQALGRAFASFNFAMWTDHTSPRTTWVKIIGRRQSLPDESRPPDFIDTAARTADVSSETTNFAASAPGETSPLVEDSSAFRPSAMMYSELPTNPSSLFPPQKQAEMAQQRAEFVQSIAKAAPLKPLPSNPSKVLWPSNVAPR